MWLSVNMCGSHLFQYLSSHISVVFLYTKHEVISSSRFKCWAHTGAKLRAKDTCRESENWVMCSLVEQVSWGLDCPRWATAKISSRPWAFEMENFTDAVRWIRRIHKQQGKYEPMYTKSRVCPWCFISSPLETTLSTLALEDEMQCRERPWSYKCPMWVNKWPWK
jgi:hypothetical protein